jgi:hypothetical protein
MNARRLCGVLLAGHLLVACGPPRAPRLPKPLPDVTPTAPKGAEPAKPESKPGTEQPSKQ